MSTVAAPANDKTLTPWVPEVRNGFFEQSTLYVRVREVVFELDVLKIDVRFDGPFFTRVNTSIKHDDAYYDLIVVRRHIHVKVREAVALFFPTKPEVTQLILDFVGVPEEAEIANEALPLIRAQYQAQADQLIRDGHDSALDQQFS